LLTEWPRLQSGGTANEIAKQIDTFAASLKGVGATIKDSQ
jgi:hypothetical protein